MEKRYYIAYGSNLNIPQMRYRCPDARVIGTDNLDGWKLLFKGSKTGTLRKRRVFVYIMHEDRPIGKPSHYYLAICIAGYKSFGFDLGVLADAHEKSKETAQ